MRLALRKGDYLQLLLHARHSACNDNHLVSHFEHTGLQQLVIQFLNQRVAVDQRIHHHRVHPRQQTARLSRRHVVGRYANDRRAGTELGNVGRHLARVAKHSNQFGLNID